MECITQCTRCDLKWEGNFDYCPKCEPTLAQAERRGIVGAFDDQEVNDDIAADRARQINQQPTKE